MRFPLPHKVQCGRGGGGQGHQNLKPWKLVWRSKMQLRIPKHGKTREIGFACLSLRWIYIMVRDNGNLNYVAKKVNVTLFITEHKSALSINNSVTRYWWCTITEPSYSQTSKGWSGLSLFQNEKSVVTKPCFADHIRIIRQYLSLVMCTSLSTRPAGHVIQQIVTVNYSFGVNVEQRYRERLKTWNPSQTIRVLAIISHRIFVPMFFFSCSKQAWWRLPG